MKETSNNFLVYSRASYLRGVEEHKKRTNFSNMQVVLSLHDAVEFCLRAIAEEFDVSLPQDDRFMNIISCIDKHFAQEALARKLPRRTQIDFLNTTRGKIKHYASIPSPQDTESCIFHATVFLGQVSQDYFDVPFDHVSLVALVHDESLRQFLYKAEQYIAAGQCLEALVLAKVAYLKGRPSAELFLGTEQQWSPSRGFASISTSIQARASSGSMGRGDYKEIHVDTSGIWQAIRESARQAEAADEAIRSKVDRLERAFVHMMIGGDVLAARRFEEITPRATYNFQTRDYEFHWEEDKEATVQMAQEALEYSTQALLRWQDMGVTESKPSARIGIWDRKWNKIELPV